MLCIQPPSTDFKTSVTFVFCIILDKEGNCQTCLMSWWPWPGPYTTCKYHKIAEQRLWPFSLLFRVDYTLLLTSECSPQGLETEPAPAQPHPSGKLLHPQHPARALRQGCQHPGLAPSIARLGRILILLLTGKFHVKDTLSFLKEMQILEEYCSILGKWGKWIYLWKYFFWYKQTAHVYGEFERQGNNCWETSCLPGQRLPWPAKAIRFKCHWKADSFSPGWSLWSQKNSHERSCSF